MMEYHDAHAALARMETCLRDTRHDLSALERSLRDRAEAETISSRPKKRRYHRRMSNWTGLDEDAYLNILDRLIAAAAADIDRRQRKIERQEAAIEQLRRKYRFNAARSILVRD